MKAMSSRLVAAAHLGGVVLAAGRSRRMGREKALLPWDRGSSLERILGALAESIGAGAPVCVVLRPDLADSDAAGGSARRAGARVLVNPDPDAEMLDSIRIGAAALPASLDAFFVWPVDHPLVSPETICGLAAAADRQRAVLPTFRGRRGHPALLGMERRADLLRLPAGSGLRDLWHGHGGASSSAGGSTEVTEVPVEDAGVVANIDTPEQYAEALRTLGLA